MPGRRKCDAYKIFDTNIGRARAFLRLFDEDRRQGRPSADETELLRASVVFAVGTLDSMLHDLILEIIPKFGGNSEALREPLRSLSKDDSSLALRLFLTPQTEDREKVIRSALDTWLGRQSFQGPKRLNDALSYIGASFTLEQLESQAEEKPAARLDHFTKLRHSMVHRGAKPRITREAAGECVDLVSRIARKVNEDVLHFYNG